MLTYFIVSTHLNGLITTESIDDRESYIHNVHLLDSCPYYRYAILLLHLLNRPKFKFEMSLILMYNSSYNEKFNKAYELYLFLNKINGRHVWGLSSGLLMILIRLFQAEYARHFVIFYKTLIGARVFNASVNIP